MTGAIEIKAGIAPRFFSRPRLYLLALAIVLFPATALAEDMPGVERRGELVRLVRNDCGACHGLRLNGGLGPALLPRIVQRKPKDVLVETILKGRPGTAMPPWANFMNEAEANWIVEQLMTGFPDAH